MQRRTFLAAGAMAAGVVTHGIPAVAAADEARMLTAKPARVEEVDVLVCGGGPAGIAAATVAARQGRKVALLERYGRLGGMAVQALVGPLMGSAKSPFMTEVLKRIGGRQCDPDRLDLHYADLVTEAGGKLWLHTWAAEVEKQDRRVTGVRAISKDGVLQFNAAVVIDATGDGDIACRAGAAFEQGHPDDKLMQPMSIMYRLAGVDEKVFVCGSEEAARKIKFDAGTWEEIVTAGQKSGALAATIGVIRLYRGCRPGERIVNATQINGVDGTKAADLTRAELECRRQAVQVLDFVRQHAPGYEQAYIVTMPAAIGVRETRRIVGVQYLTRGDLIAGRTWPEAVVRGATFPIDIHNPRGSGQAEGKEGQGGAARVKPYDIPLGCLVPRETDGLLVAGRCISGSHDAHASYRVQCIAMAVGAAAGAAAAIAAEKRITPRAVDAEQVRKVLGL